MKPRTKVALSDHVCEARKKIRRRIQGDVGTPENDSLPHFLTLMASWSLRFPFLPTLDDALQEYIGEQLVDTHVRTTLENSRCLNWCPNTTKLYPVRTLGDGNCLPHATSLFMWGIDDRYLFLRRFIYATLVDVSTGPQFRHRWLLEKQLQNSYIPNGGLDLQSTEWDREWQNVVANAEETKNTTDPDRLPYYYLEEIHIFALCNVLRRPIIVLAEDVLRTIRGTSISPNNCCGVYLPLLWESSRITKYPIVLGYNEQHFSPLVPAEFDDEKWYVIPLVKGNLGPHVVHFTTETEQRTVNAILQEYLETTEIPYTRKDGLVQILCAKLHKSDTPPEFDVLHDYMQATERRFQEEQLNQRLNERENSLPPQSFDENLGMNIPTNTRDIIPSPSLVPKQCDTIGCSFFALPEHGYLCSACLNKYLLQEGAVRRPMSDQTSLMRTVMQPYPCEGTTPAMPTAPESLIINEISEPMLLQDDLSVLNVNCALLGCKNHASYNTYPFCHEHSRRRSLSRASSLNEYFMSAGEVPTDIIRIMNRQSSRSMEGLDSNAGNPCEQMGCRLYCPPGQRYCPEHQQEYAQYNSTTTEVSLIAGKPIAQPTAGNKCKVPSCTSEARSSDTLKGFCMPCYIKENSCTDELETSVASFGEAREMSLNVTTSTLGDVNRQDSDVALNDLNSGLSSSGVRTSKFPERQPVVQESEQRDRRKCKQKGCNGKPSDESQDFCQSCIKSKKQIAGTARSEKHSPPCTRPGCNFTQAKNRQGLCYFCFKDKNVQVALPRARSSSTERLSISSRSGGRLPSEPVSRRSSWQAPVSNRSRYNSQATGEWLPQESQYIRSCKFQGCSNIMEDPHTGLCYRCFNILCENVKTPHIPEGRIHCKRRGCKYYGDPLQEGYCSRCYNGYRSKERRGIQQQARVPAQPLQFPRQGVSVGGERRVHSYSYPLNSLESPTIERIECGARQVTAQCLTAGCRNRGNSKCQGYCNACAGVRR